VTGFECPFCPEEFPTLTEFRGHLLGKHGLETPEVAYVGGGKAPP
jgi:hypothetical protein